MTHHSHNPYWDDSSQEICLSSPIFFSVLTPTWNRRSGLERLYQSLCIQESINFEWIVGDDGSEDGTLDYLLEISKTSSFSIKVISSDKRIGKAAMDNLLLKQVSGIYLICCDSDDWLLPYSLNVLSRRLIANHNVGLPIDFVVASNISTSGVATSKISVPFGNQISFVDVLAAISGDATFALRTERFSCCRHEEVDFVVTESLFYSKVAHKAFGIALDCFVKVMDRGFSNSISFSSGIKYCRGSAYSLRNQLYDSTKLSKRQAITLIRYSLNADLPPPFFMPLLISRSNTHFSLLILLLVLVPIGMLFSCRDHLLGGLVKTHVQFDRNRRSALISYHW